MGRGGGGGGGGGGDDSDDDLDAATAQATNGKLNSKEPTIFTGDQKVAEAFLLEWQIYQLVNHGVGLMRQAFTRATLFLSFIKGPDVHEWATAQVRWLMSCLHDGANPQEEYLYETVEQAFQTAFTDTMSVQ